MKSLLVLCTCLVTVQLHAFGCFEKSPTPTLQTAVQPVAAEVRDSTMRDVSSGFSSMNTSLTTTGVPFTPINKAHHTGDGPSFVTFSHSNKFLGVANESGGSISLFKVKKNGNLKHLQTVKAEVNTHYISYSPDDSFAAVAVSQATFGSLIIYKVDKETGKWSFLQAIRDFPNINAPRSVSYSPDGRFLAVSNFGNGTNGSVSIYKVSQITGHVSFADNVSNPDGSTILTFSPDGRFIAVTNFNDTSVSVFSVDPVTGLLTPIAGSPFPVGSKPWGIAYQHDGNFIAIANSGDGTVTVFAVNQVSGQFDTANAQTIITGQTSPSYLSFSEHDTLSMVGSFDSPGTVAFFCISNGVWATPAKQTIGKLARPEGVAFATCRDLAAFTIFGKDLVQSGAVNESACP